MLRGVFAGVLGICALIWPTLSFTILTRMVGLYCLADGLPGLVGALRASDRGTYLLQAIVSLVAGGVLLFLPSASARTLVDHCSGGSAVRSALDLPGTTLPAAQEAGRRTRATTVNGVGRARLSPAMTAAFRAAILLH